MGVNSQLLRDEARHESSLLVSDDANAVHLGAGGQERGAKLSGSGRYSGLMRRSHSALSSQSGLPDMFKGGTRFSKQAMRRIAKAARKAAGTTAAAGKAAYRSGSDAMQSAGRVAGVLESGFAADEEGLDPGVLADEAAAEMMRSRSARKAQRKAFERDGSHFAKDLKRRYDSARDGGSAQEDYPSSQAAPSSEAPPEAASSPKAPSRAASQPKNPPNSPTSRKASAKASSKTSSSEETQHSPSRRRESAAAKKRAQARWREHTRRSLGAQRALENAGASAGGAVSPGASAGGAGAAGGAGGVAAGGTASGGGTAVVAGAGGGSIFVCIAMIVGLAVGLALLAGALADLTSRQAGDGGYALAAWAIAEYDSGVAAGDNHSGGQPYWSHCGFGGRVEWCSCFVKTGWDACGFDQTLGSPPGAAMANSWISWVKNDPSKGQLIQNTVQYIPQEGDIVVNGEPNGESQHVGIAVSGLDERGQFRCIEGNSSDSVQSTYYYPGQTWRWVFRPNYPSTGSGTALGEGVDFNVSEQAFVREWAPRITNWYRSWDFTCPLADYGEEFARAAYKYKYDPRLSPAISRQESSGGRYCFHPYNAWGWGRASWSSWPEAIDAHVSGLSRGYSNMTIEEIVNEYCPDGTQPIYIAHLHEWIPQF